MDQEAKRLIQENFSKRFACKSQISARFYDHLFELMPDAKNLFTNDAVVQKEMFATMLATVVRSLDKPELFKSVGQKMAESHARYGVDTRGYGLASTALENALCDVVGDDISPEELAAWKGAIDRLTSLMAPPESEDT